MPRGIQRVIALPDGDEIRPAVRRSPAIRRLAAGRGLPGRTACRSPRTPTCRITVADVSGISSVPFGKTSQIGQRQRQRERRLSMRDDGRPGMERDPGARPRRPPGPATTASRDPPASAAPPPRRRTAAPVQTRRRPHARCPGRAMASSTARKHDLRIGNGIGEAGRESSLRHVRIVCMAKNCTRVAAAFRRAVARLRSVLLPCSSGAITRASISARAIMILHQRIDQRRQFGTPFLPSGDIGMADKAGLGSHRASRHRHLAQVERRTATARSAADHDQAALRARGDV